MCDNDDAHAERERNEASEKRLDAYDGEQCGIDEPAFRERAFAGHAEYAQDGDWQEQHGVPIPRIVDVIPRVAQERRDAASRVPAEVVIVHIVNAPKPLIGGGRDYYVTALAYRRFEAHPAAP